MGVCDVVFMGSAGNLDSQKSKSRNLKEETSSSSSSHFSSMSRYKNKVRYFSPVIRGAGKILFLFRFHTDKIFHLGILETN